MFQPVLTYNIVLSFAIHRGCHHLNLILGHPFQLPQLLVQQAFQIQQLSLLGSDEV